MGMNTRYMVAVDVLELPVLRKAIAIDQPHGVYDFVGVCGCAQNKLPKFIYKT